MNTKVSTFISILIFSISHNALASCGAAFCTVNTSWDAQGVWTEPGGRFDLRYEFIDQDQPQTGTKKIAVGEIPHHHDEKRTINRNLIASIDYAFDPFWGMNMTVPIVSRSHSHIHNHRGVPLYETWNFIEVGDVRVLGRYQFLNYQRPSELVGLNFGFKLPTGETGVTNSSNALAERSLQPGTGTTDILLGAYYRGRLESYHLNWFVQGLYQHALNSYSDYRSGQKLNLDLGIYKGITERISGMLQLNLSVRDRDSGLQSEPADSGGNALALSPGLSYRLTPDTQIYSFIQIPIAQRVNGVQLTADWSLAMGLSIRF